MCGICARIRLMTTNDLYFDDEEEIAESVASLYHRGPDCRGYEAFPDCQLGHTRLIINGLNSGEQPIVNKDLNTYLTVNGEIYNHAELEETSPYFTSLTGSDCDILTCLFSPLENVEKTLGRIRGMFAFVWFNATTREFLVARDPFGIIPLYYGSKVSEGGRVIDYFFASEVKAIPSGYMVFEFPPGSYMTRKTGIKPYYAPRKIGWEHVSYENCRKTPPDLPVSKPQYLFMARSCVVKMLREKLYESVESHLMSEVPFGVLLSGGLDSTIIACTVADIFKKQGKGSRDLHTFSIGVRDDDGHVNSPDLDSAQKVADAIGSTHHSLTFTVEEAIAVHHLVVKSIETYDTTTIRASIPMWLMAKKIKTVCPQIKMVLSGEGADEIFAGYLYFKKAPNAEELHAECVRKVLALHQFDCLRANKSMMAHGIETRVPFLDTPFVDWAMSIDPELKMCPDGVIEKSILRDAFKDLIPNCVYTRQKDQFSDAVGYSWIEGLKSHARNWDDSKDWSALFRGNTPRTLEEYMNRSVFHTIFPESYYRLVPWGESIACSTEAAIKWDESFSQNADPSGLSLRHHTSRQE